VEKIVASDSGGINGIATCLEIVDELPVNPLDIDEADIGEALPATYDLYSSGATLLSGEKLNLGHGLLSLCRTLCRRRWSRLHRGRRGRQRPSEI
jgi:hypothetical protein